MRDFPTDPMRQHDLLIAAICDDLLGRWVDGGSKTPNADRVMEISRQINSTREPERSNKAPGRNHGD
jgi:hypothetical protein